MDVSWVSRSAPPVLDTIPRRNDNVWFIPCNMCFKQTKQITCSLPDLAIRLIRTCMYGAPNINLCSDQCHSFESLVITVENRWLFLDDSFVFKSWSYLPSLYHIEKLSGHVLLGHNFKIEADVAYCFTGSVDGASR